jgi:polyisoprenoid-binding protein YceI
MKAIFTILLVCISTQAFAQDKYYTKSGTIIFESSVPAFEEVKAVNTKVTAILKSDGTFAALVLTKAFRFKIALMEEHFNENYMESTKFPKAKFTGEIVDFSIDDLSETAKEHTINGKLTLRGITKNITIKCVLKKANKVLYFTADFNVVSEDFGIKIPNIVRNKIAKKVDVSINFELQKK